MELLCCENLQQTPRAALDSKLLEDERVLQTLLSMEERYLPCVSYFQCVQNEIKPHMRKMLAYWMLEDWELLVLGRLKWDMAAVIAHDFLPLILHRISLPTDREELVRKHAQTFLALCATDYTFAMYPPSMIATGSVGAAVHGLGATTMSTDELTEVLAGITGTEVDCLRACQEQIETALRESLRDTRTNSSPVPKALRGSSNLETSQTSTPTDVTAVNL
ncbi:PREDICTED: G1/S-specific cyclin-D3 isoform X2 [Elephantulus edwardii]|uniref:G1/S-specific cyclin-D3 isoform X2 n=1 Tax=Elephantulus edwardii TaxID=28737 RepID=UPI0003F0AA4E|nr:PREDICTED: G1/S-specific cyclin-D3 isoform X2 [Elephantulus edwardii]